MPICVEVWGEYACFTRPEMKAERVSYDIMPPSAARGLIESIYWHPGIRWVVDRIHVLAPIRFTNLRRNEVKSTVSAHSAKTVMERGHGELYLVTSQNIQQRASMLLRDVRYVIEAHFDIVPERATAGDTPGKFQDIATRRIAPGPGRAESVPGSGRHSKGLLSQTPPFRYSRGGFDRVTQS